MPIILHRQRIRDTTIALLKAAQTAAGDRVYPSPVAPYRRDRPLPAIGVYTLREESSPLGSSPSNSGPFQLQQTLDLAIELLVELPTEAALDAAGRLALDTAAPLDALCAQVSLALLPNPLWRGPSASGFEGLNGWSTRCEFGSPTETDRRTAVAVITASCVYSVVAEPTITDHFLRAFFDVDFIGDSGAPDGIIDAVFHVPRRPPGDVGPFDEPLWPDEETP